MNSELNPTQDISKMLSGLKKRTKNIIIKRYGIGQERKMTLEGIGQAYEITRERVRQIEACAILELKKTLKNANLAIYEKMLEDLLNEHGQLMEQKYLLAQFSNKYGFDRSNDHAIEFVLRISSKFQFNKEDDNYKKTWSIAGVNLKESKQIIKSFVLSLEGKGKPVSENNLLKNIEANIKDSKTLISYLSLSKKILKNPFNEWGLLEWRTIVPKGIKDKAFLVLEKYNQPAHFTKIAELINNAKFDNKQALCQTVHNELIKDQRFVLVGRGTYALKRWGFQQGTVTDIIEKIIKENNQISKEDIVEKVLQQRLVKKNTIILALQNKQRFEKVNDKYCLANSK